MPGYRKVLAITTALFLQISCSAGGVGTGNGTIYSDEPIGETLAKTQYYVSPTGSDTTGNGSLESPWKTIQNALTTIPFDQDDVAVNLREGTYVLPSTLLIDEQRGGSKKGVFTIKSHDQETATLDGSLISDNSSMVSINSASYVSLENLEITNLIGNKSGILVVGNSTNISIYNNEIHGMHWTADAAAASSPAPSDNLNPIAFVGNSTKPMTNISVTDNKVYNLTTGYSEAIKFAGNIDGFTIENNEVFDIANIGIVAAGNYAWVGLADPRLNQARNGIIRNNLTYRCISPIAASAGIYVDGAKNITVSNNYSHHNTVGFSVGSEEAGQATGITLSGNVAADNTQAGIVIGTNTSDAIVDGVVLRENEFRGNYTTPVWGGAPIVINKSNNVTITKNEIQSISQYMVTVNALASKLKLNNNRYKSTTVTAADAVFAWVGINGENYFSFDSYKAATGQDKRSTFIVAE